MTAQASPEENERYRAGLCITGCGAKPSAGRPRCNTCHDDHLTNQGKDES